MKPYFESEGITVFRGDWRDVLPSLNIRADCIITDPPYEETNLPWDQADTRWIEVVRRENLLSRRGSMWIFGSFKYFLQISPALKHFVHAQEVIWEKHNGSNAMADRFRRVHEFAVQWYEDRTRWSEVYKKSLFTFDGQKKTVTRRQSPQHWSKLRAGSYYSSLDGRRLVRSVLKMRSCHGSAVWPTQKPLALVKILAEYSCPPSGLILDMHMGSGTTLLAARALGMRAIGIDKSRQACEVAVKRLREAV